MWVTPNAQIVFHVAKFGLGVIHIPRQKNQCVSLHFHKDRLSLPSNQMDNCEIVRAQF